MPSRCPRSNAGDDAGRRRDALGRCPRAEQPVDRASGMENAGGQFSMSPDTGQRFRFAAAPNVSGDGRRSPLLRTGTLRVVRAFHIFAEST